MKITWSFPLGPRTVGDQQHNLVILDFILCNQLMQVWLTMHNESWWGFIVELTWLLWIEMAQASLSGSCCRLRYSPPDALKIQRSLFITSTAPQRNRTRGRPVGEGYWRMMGRHNISLHAFKSSEIYWWCSRTSHVQQLMKDIWVNLKAS